ncbi:hypothetical protein ACSVDE_02360 [Pseudalkalibacillus sp. Hm43]|uniref:hypothetical protein n=1 Tax=Pseudalkalibacillus sp. Hm43 TaxID=3450742 RepID=UPI003F423C9D
MIHRLNEKEEKVYERATELLIQNYKAIKLMDEESIKIFQTHMNFIQGFVYRSMKSAAKELYGIDLMGTGIKAHKYVSPEALERYSQNKKEPFIGEHVVCKNLYFKKIMEELKKDDPDKKLVLEQLSKYYFTAYITRKEDDLLNELGLRQVMVKDGDWDGTSVFKRYETTGIKLIENSYYPLVKNR